ncbi:MAG: hypothetical protein KGL43_12420, partial [Burkholderiales bacterium]|nr:hypothetical protein [Burkholderiales bacterium]
SIWGLCVALLVAGLVLLWPRCATPARPLVAAACALGIGYVVYMFGVDVPMYWARWVRDSAQGRPVLDLAQGLADASRRWVVSSRWADWKTEVVWMTLYFSVAVWLSIGMIHVPAWLGPHRDPAGPPARRHPDLAAWPRNSARS